MENKLEIIDWKNYNNREHVLNYPLESRITFKGNLTQEMIDKIKELLKNFNYE